MVFDRFRWLVRFRTDFSLTLSSAILLKREDDDEEVCRLIYAYKFHLATGASPGNPKFRNKGALRTHRVTTINGENA